MILNIAWKSFRTCDGLKLSWQLPVLHIMVFFEVMHSYVLSNLASIHKWDSVYILCVLLCLLQATEASHPDKEKLLHARRAQEEVAEFTNEYKRRKDIGMCIDSKTNQ